jgi:hypothetical protein
MHALYIFLCIYSLYFIGPFSTNEVKQATFGFLNLAIFT